MVQIHGVPNFQEAVIECNARLLVVLKRVWLCNIGFQKRDYVSVPAFLAPSQCTSKSAQVRQMRSNLSGNRHASTPTLNQLTPS